MSEAQSGVSTSGLVAFSQTDALETVSPELHDLYMAGATKDLDDLEKLLAELEHGARPWRECVADMRLIVHNVKGQGTSFGYPMMTGIGESLYQLLLALREKPQPVAIQVIGAHVDALRTIIDNDIRAEAGSLGRKVVNRLRSLAAKVGR